VIARERNDIRRGFEEAAEPLRAFVRRMIETYEEPENVYSYLYKSDIHEPFDRFLDPSEMALEIVGNGMDGYTKELYLLAVLNDLYDRGEVGAATKVEHYVWGTFYTRPGSSDEG